MTKPDGYSIQGGYLDEVPGYCNQFISMWAQEYEGRCQLPAGHEGDHWDGMCSFAVDEDGECFFTGGFI